MFAALLICIKLKTNLCCFTDISASLLLDTIYEKAESENHNATSDQAIACPNSFPVKEPDDKEHSNKTQENIEKIDPTLECE